MELDIVHLEVSGTLDNPAVLVAVIVWSAILSGITWLVVGWIQAPKPAGVAIWRKRRRVGYTLLAFLFLSTVVTQLLLADFFYRLDPGIGPLWSVGFWGGPPILPSWVAAILIGFASFGRQKLRASRAEGSPK